MEVKPVVEEVSAGLSHSPPDGVVEEVAGDHVHFGSRSTVQSDRLNDFDPRELIPS